MYDPNYYGQAQGYNAAAYAFSSYSDPNIAAQYAQQQGYPAGSGYSAGYAPPQSPAPGLAGQYTPSPDGGQQQFAGGYGTPFPPSSPAPAGYQATPGQQHYPSQQHDPSQYPGYPPAAGYGAPPAAGYGAPPAGYGAPPAGYPQPDAPPAGYPPHGAPPAGYPQPDAPQAGGYGAPPAGYPQPDAPQAGGYGAPPAGYPQPDALQAGSYGAPPAGYPHGAPPAGYPQSDTPPAGYPHGAPPAGHPQPDAPQAGGYGAPPAGYHQPDAPQAGGYGTPPAGYHQQDTPPAGYPPHGAPPAGYHQPDAAHPPGGYDPSHQQALAGGYPQPSDPNLAQQYQQSFSGLPPQGSPSMPGSLSPVPPAGGASFAGGSGSFSSMPQASFAGMPAGGSGSFSSMPQASFAGMPAGGSGSFSSMPQASFAGMPAGGSASFSSMPSDGLAPPSLSAMPSFMGQSMAGGPKRPTTLYSNTPREGSSVAAQTRVNVGKHAFTSLPQFTLPPVESPFLTEYDSTKAMWLVSAAALVYKQPADCEVVAKTAWQMPIFEFFDVEETDTQAFGMANDDFIVVAFRGTESKRDWETNNDFSQVNLNARSCFREVKVHRGFNAALLSALPRVEAWVLEAAGKGANPHKPLYICGHSLGGALATLCYAHWALREAPIVVNGVVTVGQPRVGNAAFVEAMNEHGPAVLQRIFNTNDIVPTVPPTRLGFRHYGTRIFFTRDGRLVRRPSGSKTKLDKTKAWVSGSGGVAAHSVSIYTDLVKRYHHMMTRSHGNCAVYKAVYTVHSGAYLRGADPIDAQCLLRYEDVSLKSPVLAGTNNPAWNHVFTLDQVSEHKEVFIEVVDVKTGRFLGQVVFPLEEFQNEVHGEFLVQSRPGKRDKVEGSLFITTEYFLIHEAMPRPSARVAMKVHSARNLFELSQNPACYVRCSTQTGYCKVSPVVQGTRNPDWDFTCTIPSVMSGDLVVVEVWDRSKDACLGETRVELYEPFEEIPFSPFNLEPRAGKTDRVSGTVNLSFGFTVLPSSGLPVARAHIVIEGATDIKLCDSFVTLTVGSSAKPDFTTSVVKKSPAPKWNAAFDIDKLAAGTTLTFAVWANKLIGKDFLGQAVLALSPLSNLSSESFSLAGRVDHDDKDIRGELILSLTFYPIERQASSASLASSLASSSSGYY